MNNQAVHTEESYQFCTRQQPPRAFQQALRQQRGSSESSLN